MPVIDPSAWVQPESRVVARRVRGELVVVPMKSFDAIVLNELGAAVWEAIGAGACVGHVCARLARDVQTSNDILAFLATLVDEGLLRAGPSPDDR